MHRDVSTQFPSSLAAPTVATTSTTLVPTSDPLPGNSRTISNAAFAATALVLVGAAMVWVGRKSKTRRH